MQTDVMKKADSRLRAVCRSRLVVYSASISSKAAREIMNTTSGSKKAAITFIATEGPSASPS
jgi:hypothetical protein